MITSKQEAFVDAFCITGNATKAAEIAGYSATTARQKGYSLKKQFTKEIEERARELIVDHIPVAIEQLKGLISGAESESVRLGAIRDLLDRGGLKPTEKVETISRVESMSEDEIRKELASLRGEVTKTPEVLN
jgi:phage terminase small subunit|tara:strand:- start:107 stop:505 length:399 start_codon:yes stop_codon:yes gene_type:complete